MEVYQDIIKYIKTAGQRLKERSGHIEDIGIRKRNLTEEDIRIERELKEIITKNDPTHQVYAEEENADFFDAEEVWVIDPISGTHLFIQGKPHYAIVVSHLHKGIVQFAAVYDTSADELFTAQRGSGAFLNGTKIMVQPASPDRLRVVFNKSNKWPDEVLVQKVLDGLQTYEVFRLEASHALGDCYIACGRYNGVIVLAKDSFPSFAGSLMVQEAGGEYTNQKGESDIKPDNRIFVGGDHGTHFRLLGMVQEMLK
ncbi:MAG: inositol monophosphatase family protein [Patescibacteria group bacterium]